MNGLRDFIRESNRIEGITRAPTRAEVMAHDAFLGLGRITVDDLVRFVEVVAPGCLIRDRLGMNVRVANHYPPMGGRQVLISLMELLERVNLGHDPYRCHHAYETLHPFMDGNGRSGRVLWLWQMQRQVRDPYVLTRGFLHTFYYQTLADNRS